MNRYKLSKIEQSNIKIDSQHSEFKFFEVYDKNLQPMIKSRVFNKKYNFYMTFRFFFVLYFKFIIKSKLWKKY